MNTRYRTASLARVVMGFHTFLSTRFWILLAQIRDHCTLWQKGLETTSGMLAYWMATV